MQRHVRSWLSVRFCAVLSSVAVATIAALPSAIGQPPPPAVLQALPGLDPTVPDPVDSGFDVTDAGLVVGISSSAAAPYRGVAWTADGSIVDIGVDPNYDSTYCTSVSDAGFIFAGFGISEDVNAAFARAWIRKVSGGIQRLDDGINPFDPIAGSRAEAVSGDGTKIWGLRNPNGTQYLLRVWNTSDLSFTDVPGFTPDSSDFVLNVSRNGTVAVGIAGRPTGPAVATRIGLGGAFALPRLTQIGGNGNANALTSDGSIVVGVQGVDGNNIPFIWTAAGGTKALPRLTAASKTGIPRGIADNRVIVGSETVGTKFNALMWYAGRCFNLRSYLQSEYGVNFAGWSEFRGANAISPNGRYITGVGTYNGRRRVFRIAFNGNRLPVANAGADIRIRAKSSKGINIKLNGLASADPDGNPMTFWWSGIKLNDRTLARPTGKFPVGTTTLLLEVKDNFLLKSSDSVRVVALAPKSKLRSDGLAANESFATASSYAAAGIPSSGASGAAIQGTESAAFADAIGAAMGDAIVWDGDETEGEATVAYAELRNLQAAYGQVAVASLAQAYAETGDASTLQAAVAAQNATLHALADCGDR